MMCCIAERNGKGTQVHDAAVYVAVLSGLSKILYNEDLD